MSDASLDRRVHGVIGALEEAGVELSVTTVAKLLRSMYRFLVRELVVDSGRVLTMSVGTLRRPLVARPAVSPG